MMLVDLFHRRFRWGGLAARARRTMRGSVGTGGAVAATELPTGARTKDYVVAAGRRRSYVARVVDHAGSRRAVEANLALVVECLGVAGIPYFLVAARPGLNAVVAVAADRRGAALAALAAGTDGRACYAGLVTRKRVADEIELWHGERTPLVEAQVIRVFEVTATSHGSLLTGPDEGCDVEFWEREGDLLVAPRPNAYATEIDRGATPEVERAVGTRTFRTLSPFDIDHPFDVDFPIDAVYTWVDGQDPAWRARKNEAQILAGRGALHELAVNDSRFTSRDELRYSLRSLDRYASWIRTVYLVTDDQVPDWLDTSHPRIKVVSHRDVFDDAAHLPTFNSHAIETTLHRIPGLAEHFLYLNDDVFFGRPVRPELFFRGNGTHKFYPSPAMFGYAPTSEEDAPVDAAGKNNRDLLQARFGRTITTKFKHAPHPMTRSSMLAVENEFPEAVARSAAAQFRRPDDIAPISLAHYVAWFTHRATPGAISYDYVNMSDPEAKSHLDRLLVAGNLDAFCLNDTDTAIADYEAQTAVLHGFLEAYFPLASPFERPEP